MVLNCSGYCNTPGFKDKYHPTTWMSTKRDVSAKQKRCRKCFYAVFRDAHPEVHCCCCGSRFKLRVRGKQKEERVYLVAV